MRNGENPGPAPRRSEAHGIVSRRKQSGVSVILVVFLLAVVSVMTVSMVNLSGTQNVSSFYTLRSTQAYFSARAGIQYMVNALAAAAPANTVTTCSTVNNTSVQVQGFSVALVCLNSAQFDEGGAPYRIYSLTATASGGNFQVPDVVNRRVQANVRF